MLFSFFFCALNQSTCRTTWWWVARP